MLFKDFINMHHSRKKAPGQADLKSLVASRPVPVHVAIIMDGNGRWARKHNMLRSAGHRKGVEALRDVIRTSSEIGISYLSLFAFSTENWKRPESEVRVLMSLLVEFLRKEIAELHDNNVKIHMLGNLAGLPEEAVTEIKRATELTRNNKGLQVNIAINYGSRAEIVKAAAAIASDVASGRIRLDDISEELFSRYLDTGGLPDPDLLIRTSGECRLSNFLLYQMAYTEFVFTDKQLYWPDFTREKYLESILQFQERDRRYGGIEGC